MKNLEDNPACPPPDTSRLEHVNTAFSPFPLHLLWFSANQWPWGWKKKTQYLVWLHIILSSELKGKGNLRGQSCYRGKRVLVAWKLQGSLQSATPVLLGEREEGSGQNLGLSLLLMPSQFRDGNFCPSPPPDSFTHLEFPNTCPVGCLTSDIYAIKSWLVELEQYVPRLTLLRSRCSAFLLWRLYPLLSSNSWKDNSSFVPRKLVPSSNWQKPRRTTPHSHAQINIYKQQLSAWRLHTAPSVSMKYLHNDSELPTEKAV